MSFFDTLQHATQQERQELFALPIIGGVNMQFSFKDHLLAWLPFLIVWATLIAAYVVIPNRPVVVRKAGGSSPATAATSRVSRSSAAS